MAALHSEHRKMIKKNKSKLLSLKYSPQIYKVYKVIKPDDFVIERYLVRDCVKGKNYPHSLLTKSIHKRWVYLKEDN
jgi:hypothetical protein